ncbi:hypothetical protein DES53_1011030 [Roseimicrobium gellanilyticum]|uniref:Uncharacterized protein n=1 Tax=Roseimicrobium gellanilyticum TaxID=748857 RepID=A0A366HX11_9BACT|nr:hypothetical protein DES53_1011030 [Roseimicrobium gellanilyticum]
MVAQVSSGNSWFLTPPTYFLSPELSANYLRFTQFKKI